MFASTALAARIEQAEARLTESIGRSLLAARSCPDILVERIGGGVVVFVRTNSPANKMIGVGFDELPSDAALDRIEQAFSVRQAALQAEISTLAAPALTAMLSHRGYVLQGFEDVCGRPLAPDDRDASPPAGIVISRMASEEAPSWLDAAVTAFLHPDDQGVATAPLPPREALDVLIRDFIDTPGFDRYIARIDGEIAGVATLRIDGALAQFCGAGTLPAWRRRGVQTALLRWRLAEAHRAGCDLALLTTSPGTKSKENGYRQGFSLLYSRALLVKAAAAERP